MSLSYEAVAQGLAALTALVVCFGWAIVPVVLLWTGKVKRPPKGSYEAAWDAQSYEGAVSFLAYVQRSDSGWLPVHVSYIIGALALMLSPAFFWSVLSPRDALAGPALVAAEFGGLAGFLAVLFDLSGTPVLARIVVDDPDTQKKQAAWLVWRYVEQWRELALKALSLGLLGLWMIWLKFGLQFADVGRAGVGGLFGWVSLVSGLLLLFLGITQVVKTRLFGQRGPLGMLIMLLVTVAWSSSAAAWFALQP